MEEGKTNMFGKTYNTVGSTDSNFIIKTKGDLKVLWAGKFIDIIKNGKVASTDILKTASSSDEIFNNGIYLVGEEIWVSINGTKVKLSGEDSTTYVSFLTEQSEITSDLKYTALTNAGFYYETLEEAQNAGIKAGIIFVVGENKLYLANNGLLSEYLLTSLDQDSSLEELVISDLKIYNDGTNMVMSSPNLLFRINNKLAFELGELIKSYLDIVMQPGTYIQSQNATASKGYRLYIKNGKSVLEVDSLVLRSMSLEGTYLSKLDDIVIYSIHGNIILSAYRGTTGGTVCKLRYLNSFPTTGKVYILIPLTLLVKVGYEEAEGNIRIYAESQSVIALNIVIDIKYKTSNGSNSTQLTIPSGLTYVELFMPLELGFDIVEYNIISGPENISKEGLAGKRLLIECDILGIKGEEITIAVDSSILELFLINCAGAFIYQSNVPLIKISLNNLDVLDRTFKKDSTISDETIHTRIGIVKENDIELLKECPEKQEEVQVGIYSDNFIGLNSKLYDTVFKKRCDYPKYHNNLEFPTDFNDEKYNLIVPNIAWIKELLKQAVPSGTIAMFNGLSAIPDGWAVCDGTNGTPNLIGRFIKAVSSASEVGVNPSNLTNDNELTLTKEHLPKHNHPHQAHTHNLRGTVTTNDSSLMSLYSEQEVLKSVVTSVSGVDSTSEEINVSLNVRAASDTVNTELEITVDAATSMEDILSDSEWPNNPIKIEPRSYSLIFIMKL